MTGSSLFDIVGPVMVGPSSSHTAGAVRLGQLARQLAGGPLAHVTCTLFNSFAKTYRGHGTDRGLVAGLLGLGVADDRIRQAMDLLAETGMTVTLTPHTAPNHHPPNAVHFQLTRTDGEIVTIMGHSVGGGKVLITRVNDFHVHLRGDHPTLLLGYRDLPGMIWRVTQVIAEAGVNIATLTCTRNAPGQTACMVIVMDGPLDGPAMAGIQAIEGMQFARWVCLLD